MDAASTPYYNALNANPLRYRGYIYDSETGFYYLQSRYYDPAVCRFINADGYVSTGTGTLGYNMFAYCNNNPVVRADYTGNSWVSIVIAANAIVGGIMGIFSAVTTDSDIGESTIESFVLGAISASCGLSNKECYVSVLIATGISVVVDLLIQAVNNSGEVDLFRCAKNAFLIGLGTAIPKLGVPETHFSDAFGTALIWCEASTLITIGDVVVTLLMDELCVQSQNIQKINSPYIGSTLRAIISSVGGGGIA